jgi:dTDP-glucose 4,6-dehydratase
VRDTVAGFIAALDSDRGLGEVFNIGAGFEISIGDTARLIAEVMGAQIEVQDDPQRLRPRHSEVERLWASNARAAQVLGWKPEYAGQEGLRRGLKETVAWYRDERNLRLYDPGAYVL